MKSENWIVTKSLTSNTVRNNSSLTNRPQNSLWEVKATTGTHLGTCSHIQNTVECDHSLKYVPNTILNVLYSIYIDRKTNCYIYIL